MGFGPVDAMVVMEELGRGIVLEPYRGGRAGRDQPAAERRTRPASAAWLHGIAEGSELVVLAHQERAARYRLAQVETTATNVGGTWQPQRRRRASCRPARTPMRSSCRRASAARSTTPAGIAPLPRRARATTGVAVRGYPTQDGASAADLTLDQRERDRAARRRRRRSPRSSTRSTSASPRSAPKRSARWTSWSRSRSST